VFSKSDASKRHKLAYNQKPMVLIQNTGLVHNKPLAFKLNHSKCKHHASPANQ